MPTTEELITRLAEKAAQTFRADVDSTTGNPIVAILQSASEDYVIELETTEEFAIEDMCGFEILKRQDSTHGKFVYGFLGDTEVVILKDGIHECREALSAGEYTKLMWEQFQILLELNAKVIFVVAEQWKEKGIPFRSQILEGYPGVQLIELASTTSRDSLMEQISIMAESLTVN